MPRFPAADNSQTGNGAWRREILAEGRRKQTVLFQHLGIAQMDWHLPAKHPDRTDGRAERGLCASRFLGEVRHAQRDDHIAEADMSMIVMTLGRARLRPAPDEAWP